MTNMLCPFIYLSFFNLGLDKLVSLIFCLYRIQFEHISALLSPKYALGVVKFIRTEGESINKKE